MDSQQGPTVSAGNSAQHYVAAGMEWTSGDTCVCLAGPPDDA